MRPDADRSSDHDQCFFGAKVALVTDTIDTANQGRVKVSFPWYDDDYRSEWARVATIYSGHGYGAVWTPEQDAEVLVIFDNGDLRLPYIIGGLYNGKDLPSTQRTRDVDRKLFRTKAGHELRFDDGRSTPGVVVTTNAGHRVSIDDNANELIVSLNGGPRLVMTTGRMSLEAPSIEIKATGGDVVISGASIRLN